MADSDVELNKYSIPEITVIVLRFNLEDIWKVSMQVLDWVQAWQW